VNSRYKYGEASGGCWPLASTATDSKHEDREPNNKDKDDALLIRNPAPDSSPSAVSSGTYSEGKIRR
jgi:hypothetical protein